jgi:hypothetical protein
MQKTIPAQYIVGNANPSIFAAATLVLITLGVLAVVWLKWCWRGSVPWNNNNAEQPIKAFARLRRAIEGSFDAKRDRGVSHPPEHLSDMQIFRLGLPEFPPLPRNPY